MQGNSLISSFAGIDFNTKTDEKDNLFTFDERYKKLIEEFEELKSQYQNEPDVEAKRKLKDEIDKKLMEIFEEKLNQHIPQIKEINERAATIKNEAQRKDYIEKEKKNLFKKIGIDLEQAEKDLISFTEGRKQKNFFLWDVYFAEVFAEKVGFDIAIGNPPYGIVKSGNTDSSTLKSYQAYQTADFKINTYALFLEKALKLSTIGGVNSFIIPDSSLNLPAFKKLREFIIKNASLSFIAHYKEEVFETAAVGKSVIIQYCKGQENNSFLFRSFYSLSEFDENKIEIKKVKKDKDLKFVYKSNESGVDILLYKLKNINTKLSKYCDIYDGINPGSEEIKDALITDKKIDSSSKKIIDGKCFYRYSPIYWDGYYVYYNEEYVEKLRRKIESKGKSFTARIIKKTNFFTTPKIITRQTAETIIGTIDFDRYFVKNSVHSTLIKKEFELKLSLQYVLSILNSRVIDWYYRTESMEAGRLFPQVKIERLRNLPFIFKDEKSIIKYIDELVNKVLECKKQNSKADTKHLEDQIDIMVYKLYELTYEEVKVIDPKIGENISKIDYEQFQIQ